MIKRSSADVPVLIAGGGPVGLSLAIGLRHFGVECTVVERHPSTLDFPKGRRVTTRTVEILRQWGLETAIADVSLPRTDTLSIFIGESLLSAEFERREMPVAGNTYVSSPTRDLICNQELFEHALREQATDVGADVRFSTELVAFTQDDDGVTADLIVAGERASVRAAYMIAADGARSRAREALGIARSGPGAVGDTVSILFEADLAERMQDRLGGAYLVREPRAGCTFGAVDNKRRWLLLVPFDPDDEPPESFTEHRCLELARAGVGADDVELRYIGHRLWQPTALVADSYRVGRVLLAGDAAHVTTPVGGLGMNCGIADAHNLAWKLAGVLDGWAAPGLLESYEPERRPHAVACADASLGDAMPPNSVDGLVLGHAYDSAIVIDDHTGAPSLQDPIGDYVPTGRPGHRAPHLWLDRARSTLDLFGSAFVALTDPVGARALDVSADTAHASRAPLDVHVIDVAGWHELYGVERGGVVLVRPDGYVAWRSAQPSRETRDLAAALSVAIGWAGTYREATVY